MRWLCVSTTRCATASCPRTSSIDASRHYGRAAGTDCPRSSIVLVGNEATRGGQSWLEREYLRLLAKAGLPRPETQAVLTRAGDRLVRVDCHFPGTRVVVELLGYRFHRTKSQITSDAGRTNALLRDGDLPYQFTYGSMMPSETSPWIARAPTCERPGTARTRPAPTASAPLVRARRWRCAARVARGSAR